MKLKLYVFRKSYLSLVTLVVGLLFFDYATAQVDQQVSITGRVIDALSNQPLEGATIKRKGASEATSSDGTGNFKLMVSAGSIITVSYTGYVQEEITVDYPAENLIVAMTSESEQLDDVVVIGYGTVRKGDVTGSLTTIKPDEKNRGIQLKAEDALVGKVAGVNIVPASGAPGSSSTIRIRMGASLSATNDPLIVIDGVPVSNVALDAINPNDIETFTVLKDASATAIYGSRASNGVIIVTTKKGSLGATKPSFSYNSNFSLSKPGGYFDVLDADAYRTAFQQHANAPDGFELGNAATDWQREIFRNAGGMDHNFSVTGATATMPYRLSVGHLDQNGTLIANNFKRTNAAIGLAPKFFDNHLSVDVNLKGSIQRNRSVSEGSIGSAIGFDPTRPVYESYASEMGLGYYMWMDSGVPIVLAPSNPLSDLELPDRLEKTRQSTGNIALDYKIHGFEDLRINVNTGYDIRENKYDEMIPQYAPSMYTGNLNDGTGRISHRNGLQRNYLFNTYLNYNKDFGGNHHIDAMGGYEWQRFWYNERTPVATDLDHNPISSDVERYDEQELYLLSFFGRLNYSFAQKFMLTATLRADASSRFAKDNRWGYFPSVAAAYRLSDEPFLQDNTWLSDLKVRLSYGETGQQDIGNYYVHLADYSASYNNAQYLFGNRWITMYRPNGSDPNIRWETTGTWNAGLDYGFLNNRIQGTVDVYKRYTRDLLNTIFVPAGSNFTSVLSTNIGDMESQGFELGINTVPVRNSDWEWTLSGNFSYGTAKITKLNTIDTEDNYVMTGNAGGTGRYLQVHMVNETPNTFFLLQQAYDDQGNPLDGQYVAKDGSLTSSEADANKYVTDKSSRVPYFYGLSTRVNYKDWDFGLNGHGSFGNYVYNYQQASISMDDLFTANRVSSNITPQTLANQFTQQRIYSDHFLEKGGFFRIDNITVGRVFQNLWNNNSSLRIALSAQNVATFTGYSGLDPEIFDGIDRNTYVRPRIYTMSLNLNF
ncbi:SusC/RagA family TonB-linked outer membrane protein [Sphingobacterium chuzhouense]|uniref:SusC/RagA family TonB-linked outer membrane protein n=1 Tax=Sphingobacterium chuzhouense TaxID=1742264 RepID=A0ABR7XU25_9SPHI|nr:SusC/RagA family TonB-linked outer membrane protein [Sphingobacterium chuzhouense]MBD1422132.1 SusC/RagA family TonB-linked outer membrane protein [Sphingobacterium chuzhouense]